MKIQSYPKIAIIFPNYNGGNEPIECLESIYKLNYPKSKLEVIVIDNNSIDGSNTKIKQRFPKTKLIQNDQNLGFGKAVNQGILASNADYIFIANNDLVFEKDSLKTMVEFIQKEAKVAVVGGKIFFKSRPQKICSSGYMLNRITGNIYIAPDPDILKSPDWIQGCAMLIPMKIFKKIGLLDDGFSFYFEDIDFCFRARKAGLKVIYLPDAIFFHGETVSANKDKPNKYYHWYRNKIRFILKDMPILNILSILSIQLLIVMPIRAIILRDNRLIPFLKASYWNLLNIYSTIRSRNQRIYGIN